MNHDPEHIECPRLCDLLERESMVRRFEEESTQPNRALQIWQILIAMAANRQTTTYNALAQILGYQGAGQFMSGLLTFGASLKRF